MDIKTLVIGALLGLAVIFGGLMMAHKGGVSVTPPLSPAPLAGSAGNDLAASDHLCVGGMCTYYFTQQMTQAASTTCQWQTPAATSTVRIRARYTLASTSAALIEFGKSAGSNATTTLLARYNLGAGIQATLVSTSSPSNATGIDDVMVVAPSMWLAVKMGSGGTGSLPTGTCNFSAELIP